MIGLVTKNFLNMIKAEVVANSLSLQGDKLFSVLCTFPRIILAEVNTHRMLSKNTSSSRAIPFNKMVEAIKTNPFIPIAFQKEHKGMQGNEYITDLLDLRVANREWKDAMNYAILSAKRVSNAGITKQLANRLLEPFMWTTMLITGSEEGWENFFKLRCPSYRVGGKGDIVSSTNTYKSKKDAIKDYPGSADEPDINWMLWNEGQAEIHMMQLAEYIWDAVNESTPKLLKPGEWHIPFEDKINLIDLFNNPPENPCNVSYTTYDGIAPIPVKISVAMAARTSYTVVGEEKSVDYEALLNLHNRLLTQDPPHSSPLEHCAKAMHDWEYEEFVKGKGDLSDPDAMSFGFEEKYKGWCYNLKGFIPYRYLVDNKLTT